MSREKQIDGATLAVLNCYRNKYYADGNHTEQGIVANAINDVLPTLVEFKNGCYRKQSEWISVDERLPEEGVRVLVWLDIEDNYTNIDTDRILRVKWVRWNSFVTHWMPLPEAPKGGAE